MFLEKMNRTELRILELILDRVLPEKEIAKELNQSASWTSECIHHLIDMGFIDLEKKGVSRFARISNNSLGASLRLLMQENRILNYELIFPNSGLIILPLLLRPGLKINEICQRTHLSKRAIYYKMKEWKSIGIIDLGKYPEKVVLSTNKTYLSKFLNEYCKNRNRRLLNETYPKGNIVWEWKDEFLFSTYENIDNEYFLSAGSTRLLEFGIELVHTSEYYYFSIGKESVSLEESLVQTIRTYPMNPRPIRIVRETIKDRTVNYNALFDFAKKYGVYKILKTRL